MAEPFDSLSDEAAVGALCAVARLWFERAGWDRAAERYEECWTDTTLFLEPLLDAVVAVTDNPIAAIRGLVVCDPACGSGLFLAAVGRSQ